MPSAHQFVAILHQNAPYRVLNFKKKFTPCTADSLPQTPGRRKRGKGEGGRGMGEGMRKGEGRRRDNSLLLPQAQRAVATYVCISCQSLYELMRIRWFSTVSPLSLRPHPISINRIKSYWQRQFRFIFHITVPNFCS